MWLLTISHSHTSTAQTLLAPIATSKLFLKSPFSLSSSTTPTLYVLLLKEPHHFTTRSCNVNHALIHTHTTDTPIHTQSHLPFSPSSSLHQVALPVSMFISVWAQGYRIGQAISEKVQWTFTGTLFGSCCTRDVAQKNKGKCGCICHSYCGHSYCCLLDLSPISWKLYKRADGLYKGKQTAHKSFLIWLIKRC